MGMKLHVIARASFPPQRYIAVVTRSKLLLHPSSPNKALLPAAFQNAATPLPPLCPGTVLIPTASLQCEHFSPPINPSSFTCCIYIFLFDRAQPLHRKWTKKKKIFVERVERRQLESQLLRWYLFNPRRYSNVTIIRDNLINFDRQNEKIRDRAYCYSRIVLFPRSSAINSFSKFSSISINLDETLPRLQVHASRWI